MSEKGRALPTLGGLGEQYEIVRELGRGGTAVVYLGRDRELERDVAIKVIRSTFVEDEEAMARLVREARTVAGLQHPNIVMLYATHKLEDGSLALVMQYIPGNSLKERIRAGGPLTCAQAGQVMVDVGRALTYAHRRRIVHRDIKPENIYLDDEAGVARLSDFGIARAWDTDSNLTLPGMALGTPAYMSPEQIDGRQLDGRSDIFSLGLVGYEMLTGQQPWAGENLYTVIYRQKKDQLPAIDELRPDVPPHLTRAIDVALAKAAEDRWATAEDFIQQVQSGPLPTTAPPTALLETLKDQPSGAVSEDAATIMYRRSDSDGAATSNEGEAAATPVSAPKPDKSSGISKRRWVAGAGVALAVVAAALWAVGQSGASAEPTGTVSTTGTPISSGPGSSSPLVTDPADAEPNGPDSANEGETERGTPGPRVTDGPSGTVPIPAALRVFAGDQQQADPGNMLPNPLIVRVEDVFGAPLEGAVVRFTVESGAGFVSPDSVLTDGSGLATTEWMLGHDIGEQLVVATAPRFVGPGARFTANHSDNLPAEAAAVVLIQGADQVGSPGAALPEVLTVQVTNSAGEPLAGVAVRTTVMQGQGRVTPTDAVSDEQGRLSFQWVLGNAASTHRLQIAVEGSEVTPLTVLARAVVPSIRVRPTIVAGGTHTCAINREGALYCWGGNDQGQLGDGGGARRSTPGLVDGAMDLALISAGFTHTCAVATDGAGYCWGANESGQLGDGSASSHAEPNLVAGGVRFTSLAAGVSHTCGLAAGGQTYCWGGNGSGQLGDGTRSGRSSPGIVAGSNRFRSIAVGWTHTCGLTRGGTAYCWGRNARGQLGDGSGIDRIEPVAVRDVPALQSISAGSAHTCGVTTEGEAYCWGQNTYGQLGDGSTRDSATPVRVGRLSDVATVVAGGVHTCAVTEVGAAYCWGRNTYGQLGDGSTTDRSQPAPVEGERSFATIFASGAHTCGEQRGGTALCWGYNVAGQLGDGSRTNRSRPTTVLQLPR